MFNRNLIVIRSHFGNLQLGMLKKQGLGFIVHNVRDAVQRGASTATMDLRNAFNSPMRDKIADVLFSEQKFSDFWSLFMLEYGTPSDLLYFSGNELKHVFKSSAGTRQGSILGGFVFCAFIHPILVAAQARFPTVQLLAYMDDVTLTCLDAGGDGELQACFAFLTEKFDEVGLAVNPTKSEYFVGAGRVPNAALCAVTRRVLGSIKVLGAYIGNDADVEAILLAKLEKHEVLFERIASLGATPVAFAVLQKCALPRVAFLLATHHPRLTDAMCMRFDERMSSAFYEMAEITPTERAHAMLDLACSAGGMGITRQRDLRSLAYDAQNDTALRGAGRPVAAQQPLSQHAGTVLQQAAKREDLLRRFPEIAKHLKHTAAKHAATWLSHTAGEADTETRCDRRAFSAALRLRIHEPHRQMPSQIGCSGCHVVFAAADFDAHVVGCVRRSDYNATVKHNDMCQSFAPLAAMARLVFVAEPRDYQSFVCRLCGDELSLAQSRMHGCRARMDRSGADFSLNWPNYKTVYDGTVVHSCAPSYSAAQTFAVLCESKARVKHTLYDPTCALNFERLEVLCFDMHGGLCPNTLRLLGDLARRAAEPTSLMIGALSLRLQCANGAIMNASFRPARRNIPARVDPAQ